MLFFSFPGYYSPIVHNTHTCYDVKDKMSKLILSVYKYKLCLYFIKQINTSFHTISTKHLVQDSCTRLSTNWKYAMPKKSINNQHKNPAKMTWRIIKKLKLVSGLESWKIMTPIWKWMCFLWISNRHSCHSSFYNNTRGKNLPRSLHTNGLGSQNSTLW